MNRDAERDSETRVRDRTTKRRRLLESLGVGGLIGLAGCSGITDRLSDAVSASDSGWETASATRTTTSRRSASEGSMVEKTQQAAASYLSEVQRSPSRATFEYEPVELSGGSADDGELVAAPASDVTGDRIAIRPSAELGTPSAVGKLILATWNAPVEQTFTTTETFGEEVEFRGGSGESLAVAAGVGTTPDGDEAAFVARGEDEDGLARLVDSFEELRS